MLNKVILIGHLGQDPEIKKTNDGKEFAVFSIATSERWKTKDGEKKEKTEWHRVVCFSEGLVGVIKSYVKKGSKIYIEGSLTTRKWDDNGVDRYATEINIKQRGGVVCLLDRKEGGGNRPPDDVYDENGEP